MIKVKLKKKCLCIVAMLLMVMSSGMIAHADVVQPSCTIENSSVSPRRDETQWVFRRNPDTGEIEKRLWSITYGVWRTEWEVV